MNVAAALSDDADGAEGFDDLSLGEYASFLYGLYFSDMPMQNIARRVTAEFDLGPRGAWILSSIERGVRYPSDLSASLFISPSLVTAELTRLTRAGLIETTPDKADRRRSALSVTQPGRAICERVRMELQVAMRERLSAYSADDIRLCTRMLHDIAQIMRSPSV